MKHKILLVNPYVHDFTCYDLWMRPLGLLWIGAYLKENGYEISFIDCLERKSTEKDKHGCGPIPYTLIKKPEVYSNLKRHYKRFGISLDLFKSILDGIEKPQAILVTSMMTYWYPGVFETIKILKDKFPNVPVILGGVYATLCYSHAIKYSQADKVIKGSAEVQILKYLDSIFSIEREYPFSDPLNINELPIPLHGALKNRKAAVVATSLGCPHKCSYCASRLTQPSFRKRDISKVIEEIDYLTKTLFIKDIAFYDDALLVDAENHIIPLLEILKKRYKRQTFHTPNGIHSNFISYKIAKLMKEARFKTIRLSYEWRNTYPEDNYLKDAINYLKEFGYGHKPKIEVYIKAGLPNQTIEEIITAFIFVHEMGGYIKISDYSPVPGTEDFDKTMDKYGLDPEEPLFQNNTTFPYFANFPKELDIQELKSIAAILNFGFDRRINVPKILKLSNFF